jgi:hypothetical protein
MANYHYLVAVFDADKPPNRVGTFLAPAREIIGSLYFPSRKQAQQYLDLYHPGAQALKASACTKQEQVGSYRILAGEPTNNARGAGRKSTGHKMTVSLSSLSDAALSKLNVEAKKSNKSGYLVGLVNADMENSASTPHLPEMLIPAEVAEKYNSQTPIERGLTYSIGHEIEKNGNVILYEILAKICKKHQTYWIDSVFFINTEYGEYQGTDHPTVLLAAIKDAIVVLNTRESPLIVDDYGL